MWNHAYCGVFNVDDPVPFTFQLTRTEDRMAAGKAGVEMLKDAVMYRAASKHTATVIFLHGLGDTGHGWGQAFHEIQKDYVKLICPTAPFNKVSVNGGMRMPSWFDIYSLDKESEKVQNEDEIREAARRVHELLDYEQSSTGVSSNCIILGGFSQGGTLAVYSALTYQKPLGGIIGLSTWFPVNMLTKEVMSDANKDTPFLHLHGDFDYTVPLKWGKLSSDFILSLNRAENTYKFKVIAGLGHSSSAEEMRDVKTWIDKVIPPIAGNL